MKPTIWHGCYDKQLKGFITEQSFSHPAKYSLGLIERIFDYCLERGYLEKGSIVGDCFGGVAIGGLVAAYRGLRWIGVELEPKFVECCRVNIATHKSKLAAMGRPLPEIIQGDSRNFHGYVQASAVVSSPPYADANGHPSLGHFVDESGGDVLGRTTTGAVRGDDEYGQTPGQIGRLKAGEVDGVISSPPYADGLGHGGKIPACEKLATEKKHTYHVGGAYGEADGQIKRLATGDISAVISSPPYAVIAAGAGGLNTKPPKNPNQQSGRKADSASQNTDQRYGKTEGQIAALKGGSVEAVVSSPPFRDARSDTTKSHPTKHGGPCADRHETTQAGAGYGQQEGQIDNLPTGDLHGVVSSPPWESNCEGVMKASKFKKFKDPAAFAEAQHTKGNGCSVKAKLKAMQNDEARDAYGDTAGQIGKEKGETYWEAVRDVYVSCYKAIKPGGYIILVVKDYVKDKKRVPLCDDTARLLEHIGFVVIERVHAMLVKETTHADMFTGHSTKTTSRKSFFRRLAEKNGSPKIDFEEVIFARKLL